MALKVHLAICKFMTTIVNTMTERQGPEGRPAVTGLRQAGMRRQWGHQIERWSQNTAQLHTQSRDTDTHRYMYRYTQINTHGPRMARNVAAEKEVEMD